MTDQSSTALRDRILELETRIRRIEGFLGTPLEPSVVPLFETLQTVGKLQTSVDEIPSFIEGRIISVAEDLSILQDAIVLKLDAVNIEMGIVKKAVGGSYSSGGPSSKFEVLDPKPFEGKRSSKELENFLWDMEAYFQAARVPDSKKVSITSMYLMSDTKLWWRSRLSDVNANREKIETWKALKQELKDQFLQCNTSWLARESLRNLKHTSTVREYVKEFCSLMLDVKDMSEEDKLFNFLSGLQNWAQAKLRHQGVKDLQSATMAVDRLVDFKVVGAPNSEQEKKDSRKDRNQAKRKFKKKKLKSRLNALMAESNENEDGDEAQVNDNEMLALVDTGATHNFIADRVVQKLGLDLDEYYGQVKAINTELGPVKGVARTILKIGD
ncbi:hypothetical protein BUALT_Bualt13G0088300 [Buddleja alternifolia]|uniref:Retrotransposon gag domain-containing protein n=1 Tax=Buddleja alternifolia TaxID=168488 RepID=A0AAV6WWX3_9LAMI|nr:hypothetical protein BUALT_Bualt13G0088300 [Buddleja alternifolia]